MGYGLGDDGIVMTVLRHNLDSRGISTVNMSDAEVVARYKAAEDYVFNTLEKMPLLPPITLFGLSLTTWLLIVGGVLVMKYFKD